MRRFAVLIVAAPLAIAACGDRSPPPGQTTGAIVGGAAGAVAGSQVGSGTGRVAATIGGTLLGALLGGAIGSAFDQRDQQYAEPAYRQAGTAPIGQRITWNNPGTGNYGTVTPIREGRTPDGRPCREYNTTVYVGGQYREAQGIACQRRDGTWEMVS